MPATANWGYQRQSFNPIVRASHFSTSVIKTTSTYDILKPDLDKAIKGDNTNIGDWRLWQSCGCCFDGREGWLRSDDI
jgi:hypothetical protein